jgi:sulfoacetaldehyde dehydrogenase
MAVNLQEMMRKARDSQGIIAYWPQEKVDEMVAAAGWEVVKDESAIACAKLAAEETAMGVYEDKLLKHKKKILGGLRDLDGLKTCGVIEENTLKGLIKIAKPIGVIGALTPVTNPTSTPAGNALNILKTRNAVIFAPHPRAKKAAKLTIDFMRKGLEKIGAPVDLLQVIDEPFLELTNELMREVDLVLATGGGPMVKAAYSSGTPAYGVGPGNASVIIDETVDTGEAAKKVFLGKTFDNATSCSSENNVIIQESVFDEALAAFKSHGGYLCNTGEKARLEKTIWPDGKHLNKEIVGQPVGRIAGMAGIKIPGGTTFLLVPGSIPGAGDLFSGEKLSVILTVWRYGEFPEAIEKVLKITAYNGLGHSVGIHTTREDRILELGEKVKVSRIMVNQSMSFGNSGNYDNGMPISLTLGCGTWGGNITSENITWKHFLNVTWISKPISPVVPDEEKIFGAYWDKFGK